MTTKHKKHPGGRPSQGLTEAAVLVKGPALLLSAVAARAERDGIEIREAWRRAARAWLGWVETPTKTPAEP